MAAGRQACIISGATGCLGREFALLAHTKGFPLALIARTEKSLKEVADELRVKNPDGALVTFHACDLRDESATRTAFDQVFQQHPRPFALVNYCGSRFQARPIIESTIETLRMTMEQNFFAPANACQAFFKRIHALEDQEPRCIVNIGATASWRGRENSSAFAGAKSALRSYSQSLALEAASSYIHVSHFVIDGRVRLGPEMEGQNLIEPSSIASMVLNIMSQDSSAWTFEMDIRARQEKW